MDIENVIAAVVTIMSLLLLIVSLQSYRRSKKKKILMISLALLMFFIKGLVLSIALFYYVGLQSQVTYLGLFDVLILIMLFVALSVKS